ncbi:MAG: hypothetical protein M1608_04860 [Candidatus Omnitrophica bacterium]|nr:hypothetical protein [Candidatus Omnitrophota bacterium]
MSFSESACFEVHATGFEKRALFGKGFENGDGRVAAKQEIHPSDAIAGYDRNKVAQTLSRNAIVARFPVLGNPFSGLFGLK